MTASALRAKCLAGGSPLERPVRQHGTGTKNSTGSQATETEMGGRMASREARRAIALEAGNRPGCIGAVTPTRQKELNQRLRSDWAASATRSRVCAAHGRVRRWRYARASRCCLTFELRRERRCGAWPAGRMMNQTGKRAKCHAGASRLERRVRPHCVRGPTRPRIEALGIGPSWRLSLLASR